MRHFKKGNIHFTIISQFLYCTFYIFLYISINALVQNSGDGGRVTHEELEGAVLSVVFNTGDMEKSKRGTV